MAREALISGDSHDDERRRDAALRPKRLSEVIGQQQLIKKLQIQVRACQKLKEPMGHILFDGPPGLGKTTLATVLPRELDKKIEMTSGPALTKPHDLLPFLTNLGEGDFLFIDEIHRMPRVVEEFIYPAMEDFRVDIVLGEGLNARTMQIPLKAFTLIGATTRSGMLSAPMRDRFRMHEHLEFYPVVELAEIVRVNALKLNTKLEPAAAEELAKRSRGTPRVANSRLHWVRSYAASESDGDVTLKLARTALELAEVDANGLDKQDRRYLETLVGVFEGGPAGVEAIAATMNLPADTLADEVEPYLLREQYVIRTSRGRVATPKAFELFGRSPRSDGAGPTLFEAE